MRNGTTKSRAKLLMRFTKLRFLTTENCRLELITQRDISLMIRSFISALHGSRAISSLLLPSKIICNVLSRKNLYMRAWWRSVLVLVLTLNLAGQFKRRRFVWLLVLVRRNYCHISLSLRLADCPCIIYLRKFRLRGGG